MSEVSQILEENSEQAVRNGQVLKVQSALCDYIQERLSTGELLLATDRDGTLVPYAYRPEEATADDQLRHIIAALARSNKVTVAVVSARSIACLQVDFREQPVILAGNYGMEILTPEAISLVQPEAQAAQPRLVQLRNELAKFVAKPIGAILEDHGLSLCLHWHTVAPHLRSSLHDQIEQLAILYSDLRFRAMPTSYEFWPLITWDKGRALTAIESLLPPCARGYIYIGDTEADEPAFSWVNARNGISIRVAAASEATASQFQVPDTDAVRALLSAISAMGGQLQ